MARGKSMTRDELVALFESTMDAHGIRIESEQDSTGAYVDTHAFIDYQSFGEKGYRLSVRGGDVAQGPLFQSYQNYISVKQFVLALRILGVAANLVNEVSGEVFLPEGEDEVEAAA